MPEKQTYLIMAFANEQEAGHAYLRGLSQEQRGLRKALEAAENNGLCKAIYLYGATATDIFDAFQTYEGQIAAFHYSGHANSFQLLLETESGGNKPAYASGLMAFLSKQQSLKFVFLNACATKDQTQYFQNANIPCIATTQSVSDAIATELSVRFYKGMAAGWELGRAFETAVDSVNTMHGSDNVRDLYWEGAPETAIDGEPWKQFGPESTHEAWQWSLPKQQLANKQEGNSALKDKVRKLVAQSKMEEAFKELEIAFKGTEFEHEPIALQKKTKDIDKKSRNGLLSFDDETRERAKIAYATLELLGELG